MSRGGARPGAGRKPKNATIRLVAAQENTAPVLEEEETEAPEEAQLEVNVAPAEPQQESFTERLKSKLGLGAEKSVEPQVKSRKLTKGQQEFVDLAAPIARQAGVDAATFAWSHIAGEEYVPYLVPSDEIADKMMQPLLRILARTFSIKYKGKVTPNGLDAGASILAIVGYGQQSWKMYRAIKREEQYGEEEIIVARPQTHQAAAVRSRRPIAAKPQGVPAAASVPDVASGQNGAVPSAHRDVGDSTIAGSVDLRNLTPDERLQYEKLSRLREQDLQNRRRRAGIA